MTSSALTLRAQVTNTTGRCSPEWWLPVTPPIGPEIAITQRVTVPAHATQTVSLTPAVFHSCASITPRCGGPIR